MIECEGKEDIRMMQQVRKHLPIVGQTTCQNNLSFDGLLVFRRIAEPLSCRVVVCGCVGVEKVYEHFRENARCVKIVDTIIYYIVHIYVYRFFKYVIAFKKLYDIN